MASASKKSPRGSGFPRAIRSTASCVVATALLSGMPLGAGAVGDRRGSAPSAPSPRAAQPAPPDLDELDKLEVLHDLPVLPLRAFAPSISREGWFGIGLRCSDCTISEDDSTGAQVWQFDSQPEIYSVDPDGPAKTAGLARGDLLTHIDGIALTSPEGGRRFGAVRPGDKVQWTFERDGKSRSVTLVAEKHPDRVLAAAEARAQLRDAIERIREQQDELREQGQRLHFATESELGRRTLEAVERQLEAAQRSIERTNEALARRRGARSTPASEAWAPEAPEPPEPPPAERQQHLRYQGTIAGSRVEVQSSGSVVVTEDHGNGEIVITTSDATIRIRKGK